MVFRDVLTQSNTTHKSVPLILSSVATGEHAAPVRPMFMRAVRVM